MTSEDDEPRYGQLTKQDSAESIENVVDAEAMSTSFGQVEHFDESTSDWLSYEERVLSFLRANKVPAELQVDAFVSLIGPKTYALLKSLTAPETPSSKSFEELRQLLRNHLSPKPSVIGERAKFHRRSQTEDETISEFVAEIRRLAQTCEFGNFLDESLRDRFVCGLRRVDIQRHLFSEDKHLTFQKAVERALSLEAAIKNASATHSRSDSAAELNKLRSSGPKPRVITTHCSRCGSPKHEATTCPHAQATCYKCHRQGHIQRACKSKTRSPKKRFPVRSLETQDEFPLNGVTASARSTPIMVEVQVQGTPLSMELDTGAAVSIISRSLHKRLFPSLRLEKTPLRLRTYTGQVIKPNGVLHVNVESSNTEKKTVTTLMLYRRTGRHFWDESGYNTSSWTGTASETSTPSRAPRQLRTSLQLNLSGFCKDSSIFSATSWEKSMVSKPVFISKTNRNPDF